jgi:hypothetical protein
MVNRPVSVDLENTINKSDFDLIIDCVFYERFNFTTSLDFFRSLRILNRAFAIGVAPQCGFFKIRSSPHMPDDTRASGTMPERETCFINLQGILNYGFQFN